MTYVPSRSMLDELPRVGDWCSVKYSRNVYMGWIAARGKCLRHTNAVLSSKPIYKIIITFYKMNCNVGMVKKVKQQGRDEIKQVWI